MSSAWMHCACSTRCRSPSGRQTASVASKPSSASRFARSPIACTATGIPAAAAASTTSASPSGPISRIPPPPSSSAVREPSVPSMNTFT